MAVRDELLLGPVELVVQLGDCRLQGAFYRIPSEVVCPVRTCRSQIEKCAGLIDAYVRQGLQVRSVHTQPPGCRHPVAEAVSYTGAWRLTSHSPGVCKRQ